MNCKSASGGDIGDRRIATFLRTLLMLLLTCVAMPVPAAEGTDAMLSAYIEALNERMPPRGEPETVADLFTADAIHYHPFGEPQGGPLRGREALQRFFGGFGGLWADWTHVERRRTICGRRAIWEGIAQGTSRQSGKHVALPIVFVIDFADSGKVREKSAYVDLHTLSDQLR